MSITATINDLALGGTPDQLSGGDISAPSQVYWLGIYEPFGKAGEYTEIVGGGAGAGFLLIEPYRAKPAAAATTATAIYNNAARLI
jgi:hypothetical protein